MSWRTVVISNRCKLDLSMGYMVVRGEETKRLFISEIAVLVIENPAVSLTGCLLAELEKQKVRVIFCDEKRSPYAELQPYYGSFDCSRKLKTQASWTEDRKNAVWTEIIAEKIRNQAKFLRERHLDAESRTLFQYIEELQFGDKSNREGHAAKVYFNALFGKDFSRGQENPINANLNYGYSLLLSAFNREVTIHGYSTQLGLFHDNMFNAYNLSCDLMEPFRILVDREVVSMQPTQFETEEKRHLIALLNTTVYIDGSRQTLLNAVRIYTRSIFDAINDADTSMIQFATI